MDTSRLASSATRTTTTYPASSTGISEIVAAVAKQLHHHPANERDSSDCIGTSKTHQPLLEAIKKRIVELSMAKIEGRLDSWLESDDLQGSRGVKRRRGGDDSGGVPVKAVGSVAEKKRAKREPTKAGLGGKKLACPFAQHDPARYAGVKTCMGPGWGEVHRVKEHIYRKHSLKTACNRCFESFDDAKELKDHQRAPTPCQLSNNARTDVITDEQEDLLRVRARANTSEEERWGNMYRVLFPDDKTIPSPFYSTPVLAPVVKPTATATTTITTAATPGHDKSSTSPMSPLELAEYKALVRREILRAVKPMLVAEVERAFLTAEVKAVQKANEIARDMECKLARTWQWQAQAEPTPERDLDATVPDFLGQMLGGSMYAGGGGNESDELGQVIDGFAEDPRFPYLMPTGELHWDPFIAAVGVAESSGVEDGDCLGSSGGDSAYYTGGLDAVGSESWESARPGRM
ncbi:hypothetical protein QBC39DRAFT_397132 [Podospora conica]|nr:hypothetical protein QBC39DRAFT_397132 [Schizothecium conicum]